MESLALSQPWMTPSGPVWTHSKVFRAMGIYGKRLARKLSRRSKNKSAKWINWLLEAPHLKDIHEDDIDTEVAHDIERLVKMKCQFLLERFWPTDIVSAAIEERWQDIMLSLEDIAVVWDEIRVTDEAVTKNFSRIMTQIASRLLALQSPTVKSTVTRIPIVQSS